MFLQAAVLVIDEGLFHFGSVYAKPPMRSLTNPNGETPTVRVPGE